MLGLVLCAFFVFGVMTGFSAVGRAFAGRVSYFISSLTGRVSHAAPSAPSGQWFDDKLRWAEARFGINLSILRRSRSGVRPASGAIAIVERHDGFYGLFSDGELRGPLSPNAADDLPVLSGRRAENARGEELVELAAVIVRAEAQLSHMVSEMNVDDDGTASLYLDRERTAVIVDLGAEPLEVSRAAEILGRWRDREQMIAAIDMTTPGQAVVRLADATPAPSHGAINKVSDHVPAKPRHVSMAKRRSPLPR